MNVELLKYIGSILAGVVGIMRAIPSVAGYFLRRNTVACRTRRLRIVRLSRPAPWARNYEKWPEHWPYENFRRMYWRRKKAQYVALAVLLACISVLYVVFSAPGSESTLTLSLFYIVAALYACACLACLMIVYNIGRRPYEKWSPLRRKIEIVVAGTRADILQQCYTVLESIGAKIVIFDEIQETIEASTGLWIPYVYAGQRLLVSLSSSQCGSDRTIITMSSDDISPAYMFYVVSPHSRNVDRFLRQWTLIGI
jgi:hypothetical protein